MSGVVMPQQNSDVPGTPGPGKNADARPSSRPSKYDEHGGFLGGFLASSSDWKTERPGMTESVGVSALSYLLSGPVVFALIGFGLDRWLHTGFLVLVGLLAGMALSIYLIWFRYGAE
ncbi:AtpZ/AtpI family protein [Flexivirga sp. B27]